MKRVLQKNRPRQNIPLFVMLLPVFAFYLTFKYSPMAGLVIAFKDYNFADGVFGSPWVGLENFRMIFRGSNTLNIIRNTLLLSLYRLLFGFPVPVLLALLLNEVRSSAYKRTLQTIIYIPHFFSWVIIGGIVATIFAQEAGIVNHFVKMFTGGVPYPFLYKPNSWIAIFIGSDIWKEAGFGTIIYLAALAGIDPSLYESAVIDGANKWQQLKNITLPGIKSIIFMRLILATGNIMDVGFDQVFMLQNGAVNDVADVISTYVYRVGLQGARFSLATAMGLFESFVGMVLIMTTNRIAKRFDENLW